MRDVSDAITRFIQLEDVFRGKAGDSIRDFYATCHIPFIQFMRLFLRDYENALKSIRNSLVDLEPSVDGVIDTGFVVNDVHMGLNKVSGVAESLTASVNDTLRSIQDIVDVKLIDDTELQSSVQRTRNEANMVVERVLEFDYRSTATLSDVKDKLGIAMRYVSELSGAFESGKLSVSNFDIEKLSSLQSYEDMTSVVNKEIGMAVKERLSKYFKLRYLGGVDGTRFNPRYFISAGLNVFLYGYFSKGVSAFNPRYFVSNTDGIYPTTNLSTDVDEDEKLVCYLDDLDKNFIESSFDFLNQGAGAVWDGTKWVGGKVWGGTTWAGGKVWDGTTWVGGKVLEGGGIVWDDAKWLGNTVLGGAKWLGGKTLEGGGIVWDDTKWVGDKVWSGATWTYHKAMNPIGNAFDWWDNTVVSQVEDFAWLIAVEDFLSEHVADGARTGGSVGLDLLPLSSNAKGIFEILMGYDPATGNDLGHGERLISGFSAVLGPISDSVKHGGRGIKRLFNNGDNLKVGDKVSDVGRGISGKTHVNNPYDAAGNLKPNVRYRTGEYNYIYETDELGRISKFETDNLQLTARDTRLKHDPNTPGKQPGDHAGHVAADRFGGSPDLDNLVSQTSNVNLSQYKVLENQWATAIKEGKHVKVNVELEYNSVIRTRPSGFKIEYEIDGVLHYDTILN
ncbi:DNA/RNA non-specific endonuclease [Bacillus sp. A301a_S52]|jgi:hypothetical protein|nr:DNA/RNA non-specific endonuclease [Bacillus sp. A301a_S52]